LTISLDYLFARVFSCNIGKSLSSLFLGGVLLFFLHLFFVEVRYSLLRSALHLSKSVSCTLTDPLVPVTGGVVVFAQILLGSQHVFVAPTEWCDS
jgi:hypothetical protein